MLLARSLHVMSGVDIDDEAQLLGWLSTRLGSATSPGVCVMKQAEGGVGTIYRVEVTDGAPGDVPYVPCMLKIDNPPANSKDTARKAVRNVSSHEVLITRFVWTVLGCSGLSNHVLRPLGLFEVIPRSPSVSSSAPPVAVASLAMEVLRGLPTVDGRRVYNLSELISEAARNNINNLDTLLPSILFQVMYTVAALGLATTANFRHNDLHACNIGLTVRGDGGKEDVQPWYYVMEEFCPSKKAGATGSMFVQRPFAVSANVRAVILDYGWAALMHDLKPVHPTKDRRFFDKDGKPLSCCVSSGMSSTQRTHHYDSSLLMHAVFQDCVTAYKQIRKRYSADVKKLPPAVASAYAACKAFLMVYRRHYGQALTDKNVVYAEYPGRLKLDVQQSLVNGRHVRLAQSPLEVATVPRPEQLLMSDYFKPLRVAEVPVGASYVFGKQPSLKARGSPVFVVTPSSKVCAESSGDQLYDPDGVEGLVQRAHKAHDQLLCRRAAVSVRMTKDQRSVWTRGQGIMSAATVVVPKAAARPVYRVLPVSAAAAARAVATTATPEAHIVTPLTGVPSTPCGHGMVSTVVGVAHAVATPALFPALMTPRGSPSI